MKMKIVPSSGNVFRDLGFSREEAEHLRIRSILMLHVQDIVRGRRLRQTQAAKILGVTQPRVSDLLRGRIDLFSTDTLIDMLTCLGGQVKLVVRKPRKKLKVAFYGAVGVKLLFSLLPSVSISSWWLAV